LILYKVYYIFDIVTKREIDREQYDLLSWTLAYNAYQRPSSHQALLHPSLLNSNIYVYQQWWDIIKAHRQPASHPVPLWSAQQR